MNLRYLLLVVGTLAMFAGWLLASGAQAHDPAECPVCPICAPVVPSPEAQAAIEAAKAAIEAARAPAP